MMCKTTSMGCVVLVIYKDDILLTSSGEACVFSTIIYLHMHFVMRNLQIP